MMLPRLKNEEMKWPKAQSVQEWRMLLKMFLQMEKDLFSVF